MLFSKYLAKDGFAAMTSQNLVRLLVVCNYCIICQLGKISIEKSVKKLLVQLSILERILRELPNAVLPTPGGPIIKGSEEREMGTVQMVQGLGLWL